MRSFGVEEFDAQADRQGPIEDDLNPEQVTADDVDLAAGLRGLSAIVAAGRGLELVLATWRSSRRRRTPVRMRGSQ
jgi:hypothetical protein